MPRAEKLSTRLDTLLDAVFEMPSDPYSLYTDLAATLHRDQLAPAQTKIRKILRQKGEIRADSAVLVACVLHLTGFPAHRILHFLSLWVPGGIRLSLFELAVNAIFPDQPPIPASLLYDLTQYTYLEKRLLARKSIEISEKLKESLSPEVLLYLYLLSLRDDLSNENIQLIALIMKNCFPALEVRTRIGGATLEEYGAIARAWKLAERRSLDLDVGSGSGSEKRGMRVFDRNSASVFLDRYFSDEALAEMRARAPALTVRKPIAKSPLGTTGAAARGGTSESASPAVRTGSTQALRRRQSDDVTTPEPSPSSSQKLARGSAQRMTPDLAVEAVPQRPPSQRPSSPSPSPRAARAARAALPRKPAAALAPSSPHSRTARTAQRKDAPGSRRNAARITFPRIVDATPTILAALVIAVVLVAVRPFGGGGPAALPAPAPAVTATAAPAPSVAPPADAAPVNAAPAPAPGPDANTYVVKPGDSLWKIFTTALPKNPDRKGWIDFLSRTQSVNSLADPDQIRPGKVLTLSPPAP